MRAQALRDILFAHAIETAAPHESLPSAAARDAITAQTLHAQGDGAASGRAGAQFQRFLQERAQRIIAAAQLPADVRQVWLHASGISRLAVIALLVLAFVLGFAGHSVLDPHRVDLLSPALIGIVLWNLLAYALLLLWWLRGLLRAKKPSMVLLQPSDGNADRATEAAQTEAHSGWWQKLRAPRSWQLARGNPLRKLALNFERNWWRLSAPLRRAQWLAAMHSAAALLACGALASLWVTGLTREYQVGWESTFLSAAQVQQVLNVLFSPVQHLFAQAAWSLQEIEALQGWRLITAAGDMELAGAGTSAIEGARWVHAYSLLLALLVIVPRALLALWQLLRAFWLGQRLSLPLQQAYFMQLQRDWSGRASMLQVLPYSLEISAQREAALQSYVREHFGAGARLQVQTGLAYGATLPASQAADGVQQVLLLNLAATPEAEIHGDLLRAARNRWGAQTQVWLWSQDFVERNSGAPARVQERRQLWLDFVRSAGLNANLIPDTKK